MQPHINPVIDCVFKAVLGSVENTNLLIHFLNAVLNTKAEDKIVDVEIINPYSVKEFLSDKQFIVDVRARGESGEVFQVEMQLSIFSALRKRMQYTFFDLYAQQIQSGDDYEKLQPTISIWLLTENLFDPKEKEEEDKTEGTKEPKEKEKFHRTYTMYDQEHQDILVEGCSLHILELQKWEQQKEDMSDLDIWIRFFKEGEEFDDEQLPEEMKTDEVIQAMKTLRRISEKEEEYHLYQSRVNAIRQQNAIMSDMKALKKDVKALKGNLETTQKERDLALERELNAQKEKELALEREVNAQKERDLERKEKELVQAELERLKKQLEEQGKHE